MAAHTSTKTAVLPSTHRQYIQVRATAGSPPAYTSDAHTHHPPRLRSPHDLEDDALIIDDENDLDDDEELPTYADSAAPPTYSRLPPIFLGVFPAWKATAPRTLIVRRCRAEQTLDPWFSVSFPSGRPVLEVTQPRIKGHFALSSPRIPTPAIRLVQLADRPGEFALRDEQDAPLVRIGWSGKGRAGVSFADALGAAGDVRLDVRATDAQGVASSVLFGAREVARLSHRKRHEVQCNVEEGVDALVVAAVALSLLALPAGGVKAGAVRRGSLLLPWTLGGK